MRNTESLQLFEDQPIRTAWDAEAEEWYFSIVDVVGVLTDQPAPISRIRAMQQSTGVCLKFG